MRDSDRAQGRTGVVVGRSAYNSAPSVSHFMGMNSAMYAPFDVDQHRHGFSPALIATNSLNDEHFPSLRTCMGSPQQPSIIHEPISLAQSCFNEARNFEDDCMEILSEIVKEEEDKQRRQVQPSVLNPNHSTGSHTIQNHTDCAIPRDPHTSGPVSSMLMPDAIRVGTVGITGSHSVGSHSVVPHSVGTHSVDSHIVGTHSVSAHIVGTEGSLGSHSVGTLDVGSHSVDPHRVGMIVPTPCTAAQVSVVPDVSSCGGSEELNEGEGHSDSSSSSSQMRETAEGIDENEFVVKPQTLNRRKERMADHKLSLPATDTRAIEKKNKRRVQVAKAGKRHRTKKKESINQFRARHIQLQEKLRDLRLAKGLEATTSGTATSKNSFWKEIALRQRLYVQHSQEENVTLRDAIVEQVKYNRTLEAFLRRQPRNPKQVAEAWREFRLDSSDPKKRAQDIHAIANHQYERFVGAMLQADLLDCREDYVNDSVVVRNGKFEMLQVARCILLGKNLEKPMDEAMNELSKSSFDMKEPRVTRTLLETIDEDTIYLEQKYTIQGNVYVVRIVTKKFQHGKSQLHILRTILHDVKHPNSDYFIGDEATWVMRDYLPDGSFTHKYLLQLRAPVCRSTKTAVVSQHRMASFSRNRSEDHARIQEILQQISVEPTMEGMKELNSLSLHVHYLIRKEILEAIQ